MKGIKKTDKKPFYHQLVSVEEIHLHFKKLGLADEEEKETWSLIEETIFMRVLDALLERLSPVKHEEFLELFTQNPTDLSLWDFLESEVADIKVYLKEASQSLEKEILEDILTSLEEN